MNSATRKEPLRSGKDSLVMGESLEHRSGRRLVLQGRRVYQDPKTGEIVSEERWKWEGKKA